MAKHLLIPATSLLLILILILHVSPPTRVAATSENKSILDSDGDPVEAGTPYYVLTAGRGAAGAGGLTMAPRPNNVNLCPLYVGQLRFWNDNGMPVTFFPSNSSEKQIYEGMNVNIGFNVPNYCRSTGRWTIKTDPEDNQVYVSTDGPHTLLPMFKVENTGFSDSYKLVYCSPVVPPIWPPVEPFCAQLAPIKSDSQLGLRWLSFAPVDERLAFFGYVFVKADKLGETSSINKLASVTST